MDHADNDNDIFKDACIVWDYERSISLHKGKIWLGDFSFLDILYSGHNGVTIR